MRTPTSPFGTLPAGMAGERRAVSLAFERRSSELRPDSFPLLPVTALVSEWPLSQARAPEAAASGACTDEDDDEDSAALRPITTDEP